MGVYTIIVTHVNCHLFILFIPLFDVKIKSEPVGRWEAPTLSSLHPPWPDTIVASCFILGSLQISLSF